MRLAANMPVRLPGAVQVTLSPMAKFWKQRSKTNTK